jgi:hypothetical protein
MPWCTSECGLYGTRGLEATRHPPGNWTPWSITSPALPTAHCGLGVPAPHRPHALAVARPTRPSPTAPSRSGSTADAVPTPLVRRIEDAYRALPQRHRHLLACLNPYRDPPGQPNRRFHIMDADPFPASSDFGVGLGHAAISCPIRM